MTLLAVDNLTVSFPTADGTVQAVRGLSFSVEARQDPRGGRRVGFRQERERPHHARPQPRRGHHRLCGLQRQGAVDDEPAGAASDSRGRHRDDLPGSAVEPSSPLSRGMADRGGDPRPQRGEQGGCDAAGGGAPPAGEHPAARAPRRSLSPRDVRRDAPARDDRHGACAKAQAADRRRADHRAGRDRASPAHGTPDPDAARGGDGDDRHHPRPRCHRLDRGRGARHVRGAGRRAR